MTKRELRGKFQRKLRRLYRQPMIHSLRTDLRIDSCGLLAPDINLAHCNNLRDKEYQLIANSGASVSITPAVEMNMGHGFPVTRELLEYGVRPSLGVDTVNTIEGDMFTQMKLALSIEHALRNQQIFIAGQEPEKLDLTTRDVLEFATIEGARALGLDKKVGTLTPGKEADILLIRYTDLNLTPIIIL
ncbi:amidohydrolase family protein [Alicyclobacillus fastidiosus]|uniref:Amidohydrolase family protein n=2 Tax=Alicyclobacillus fastidiosus TaxID=392011 RepID=A0ABY6ZDZ8_9BACL|nr:amidohydrolase family protein [Alicyclobacillus fastidiosus]WAH41067.1 amidohydrolase family protein [Alicyclobacillus fastidiosus]GMA62607.1 hypothetical protein GCM10025859_30470 [Alicyclobacillus fastidiosus]